MSSPENVGTEKNPPRIVAQSAARETFSELLNKLRRKRETSVHETHDYLPAPLLADFLIVNVSSKLVDCYEFAA